MSFMADTYVAMVRWERLLERRRGLNNEALVISGYDQER
jgi:hypothetical protein